MPTTTATPAAGKTAPAKKSASQKSRSTSSAARSPAKSLDAIALLKEDHKKAKKLFKDFDKMKDKAGDEEKRQLVRQICEELKLHTQIEEEIFYPALRKSIKEQDMLDEATVEHASAKDLIRQLESMSPSDDLYDAKVTVLAEYVNHHVEEEEGEMFKKARKAKVDMEKLAKKLASRKRAIQKESQLH